MKDKTIVHGNAGRGESWVEQAYSKSAAEAQPEPLNDELVAQRMNCMGCNKPNPDKVDHNDVEEGILWCYCRDCDIWTEHDCPPE